MGGKGNKGRQSFARFSKSLVRHRFRHAASQPARCPDLPVSTCRVQVGAIFDVRALLTPPLAAECMVGEDQAVTLFTLKRRLTVVTENGSKKKWPGSLVSG